MSCGRSGFSSRGKRDAEMLMTLVKVGTRSLDDRQGKLTLAESDFGCSIEQSRLCRQMWERGLHASTSVIFYGIPRLAFAQPSIFESLFFFKPKWCETKNVQPAGRSAHFGSAECTYKLDYLRPGRAGPGRAYKCLSLFLSKFLSARPGIQSVSQSGRQSLYLIKERWALQFVQLARSLGQSVALVSFRLI